MIKYDAIATILDNNKQGFSLVELSIVLVILGLLTGGILTGQSLIHAAELRAVTTEIQQFQTATNIFKQKYFALPGDMSNAESFWGRSTACGGTSAEGVCNGNGDYIITYVSGANAVSENHQLWRHMALAGLINGNYSGRNHTTPDVDGYYHKGEIGVNVPTSKLRSGSKWNAFVHPGYSLANDYFNIDHGNLLRLSNAPVKAEDMWNIDTKMDDGKPGQGKIFSKWSSDCSIAVNQNDFNAVYQLSGAVDTSCQILLPQFFK